MKRSLPPSSKTVFFICEVALCATLAPTRTLPVKAAVVNFDPKKCLKDSRLIAATITITVNSYLYHELP